MFACQINYKFSSKHLKEFEDYARLCTKQVQKFGSIHHGFFFVDAKPPDAAFSLFSFATRNLYDSFHILSITDLEYCDTERKLQQIATISQTDASFFRSVDFQQTSQTERVVPLNCDPLPPSLLSFWWALSLGRSTKKAKYRFIPWVTSNLREEVLGKEKFFSQNLGTNDQKTAQLASLS